MFRVCKCAAVEVVNQCTCSLVAALAAAVYSAYVGLAGIVNCLNSFYKVIRCPCAVFFIQILKSISSFEDIAVTPPGVCCDT